jgi:hypothetical protein
MNAAGVVLFAAQWVPTGAGKAAWGIFRWDPQTQQLAPVAVPETRTTNNQVIVLARSDISPVVNNSGEAVFSAVVKDAAGKQTGGLFFMDARGDLQSIVPDGAALPNGRTFMGAASYGSVPDVVLNDAGMVALAASTGGYDASLLDTPRGCYLWWKQTGVLLATGLATGESGPGSRKIGRIARLILHPTRARLMVEASLGDVRATPGVCVCTVGEASTTAGPPASQSAYAQYQQQVQSEWSEGGVRNLWVTLVYQTYAYALNDDPQKVPLLTDLYYRLQLLRYSDDLALEDESVQAQPLPAAGYIGHVTVGTQGLPAASLVGWDGQVQPVVMAGTATAAGAIQDLGGVYAGYGMAANTRGQVAMPADLRDPSGFGGEAVLLLTPAPP